MCKGMKYGEGEETTRHLQGSPSCFGEAQSKQGGQGGEGRLLIAIGGPDGPELSGLQRRDKERGGEGNRGGQERETGGGGKAGRDGKGLQILAIVKGMDMVDIKEGEFKCVHLILLAL